MINMESLPIEMAEKILEGVFLENPEHLLEVRQVSKSWRHMIDQFLTRFEVWYKACIKHIPKTSLNDILKVKFPSSTLPWRESFWKDARAHNIPREVFFAWKNLPAMLQNNFTISEVPSSDGAWRICQGCISDTYTTILLKLKGNLEEKKSYVYDLTNFKKPILQDSLNRIRIDFYSTADRSFLIVKETVNNDSGIVLMYIADFLRDNNRQRSVDLQRWHKDAPLAQNLFIIENECFVVDGPVVTHRKRAPLDGLQLNEKIVLPLVDGCVINNMQINGSDLEIVVLSTTVSSAIWIYRYEIVRAEDGKLSFVPQKNDFCTNLQTKYLCVWRNDGSVYLKTETSQFIVNHHSNRRSLNKILSEKHRFDWWFFNTYNQKLSASTFYAGYLIVGTYAGTICIFDWDFNRFNDCMDGNGPAPDCIKIDLELVGYKRIEYIDINFDGAKPRIIANTAEDVLLIDFFPPQKNK